MAHDKVLQALEPVTFGMPRTLFLLSPSKVKGGNYCTISRIRSHLVKHGHTCMLWDLSQLEQAGEDPNQVLEDHGVDLVIGIHAFRTGRVMKDFRVPYVLILGGTDVNEFCKDEQRLTVMTCAVSRASYVISFSESLQRKALALWPNVPLNKLAVVTQGEGVASPGTPPWGGRAVTGAVPEERVRYLGRGRCAWTRCATPIPPPLDVTVPELDHVAAVATNPCCFSLCNYLRDKHGITDAEDRHIFVMVGAVRPVKNPLYLFDAFAGWIKENAKVIFVIIGPVADEVYFHSQFLPSLERAGCVIHIPGLTSGQTHAAIQQSFALVNTSESEGMSLAILEAMQLKTPVLARSISGNSVVIEDGINGILFSAPQEFVEKAQRLLRDSLYRCKLIAKAAEYTALYHSMQQEETAYLTIIKRCLSSRLKQKPAWNGITETGVEDLR